MDLFFSNCNHLIKLGGENEIMGLVGGDGLTIPGYDLYILFSVFITSFILIYLLSRKRKLNLLS